MAKKLRDAVSILQRYIDRDPEWSELVEKERWLLQLSVKIREMRQQAKVSQKELASRIGTTQSVISRIESGNYERLNISTLLKIANALQYRMDVQFTPSRGKKYSKLAA